MSKCIKHIYVILALIFMLSACTNNEKNYTTVIPKDATLVVKANMKNLVEKSDLSNSPIIAMAKQSLGVLMGKDAKKHVEDIMNDPSLTGLNFDLPVYLFQTKNNYTGLSICVDDESLLDEFLNALSGQNICTKVKERDGLKCCKLLDDINVAYDDNTLLLLVRVEDKGISSTQNDGAVIQQLFDYNEDNSFIMSENAKKMNDMNCEDFQIYSNLAAIPSQYIEDYKSLLPAGVNYSDVNVIFGVDFLKGSVSVKTLLCGNNAKAQKIIDDGYDSFKPIQGTYLSNIPKNNKTWICFGSNGKKGLEQIKKFPAVKEMLTALNLGIDADNIIRAIDGDVLLLSSKSADKSETYDDVLKEADFSLVANLKNSDFMKDMDYWMESSKEYGVNIVPFKDQYKLRIEDKDYYMDVKKNNLYFGTIPSSLKDFITSIKNDKDVVGKYIYAQINLKEQVDFIDKVTISSSGVGEITINILTQDKSDNVLKQILKAATGLH